MRYLTSAAFFTVLFLSAVSVYAQNPTRTPPDEDVLKISTTLIQVDVTVTGKDGKVINDLKAEDFEVYENGKKQDITNFSFISVNKPIENRNQQTIGKDKNSIPIPPVRLKTDQVRRTYALVVDDLGLSFTSIFWVKESLRKFVDEQMSEGDLVAIIRTGSGVGALQSFTSDKRQLLAAIGKIKWNFQGRSGIHAFKPIEQSLKEDLAGSKKADGSDRAPVGIEEDKEFERQIENFRNENFSIGTLGALDYIIRGMGELPGRKAVMLFSDGFKLKSDKLPNRILNGMRVLADLANRSSVVIYTLDPRGLDTPGMANANDNIRKIIDKNFDPVNLEKEERTERAADFLDTQQSLRYLAYETGGIPFINQNNLNKGLQQAVDDQSGYYLLGYQPDEDTFDAKKNKFNRLEIKLTRPQLKVRYRSGFFGITDEKIKNVAQTPQQKLMTALISPFGATDIDLNLYPVYQNDEKSGDVIQALVYINARDLKFTEAADGKHKANFDLVAMTFGDNGVPVDRYSKNHSVEAGKEVYRNMMENGIVYTLPVPVKKSGAYQFRIALRDTNSNKVGSATQFIEVPNIRKKMALSNIILDNFTTEEWKKVKPGGSRGDSERDVLFDTTRRQFKGGTIVRYNYVIYNPKSSRQIETQLRLIKNGQIVYEKNSTPLKIEGQMDLLRLPVAGMLTLGKNLGAGSYVLQVIAVNGESAKNFGAQSVEFEIVE